MLLTRKSQAPAQAVNPLARAVSTLAAKTVDRRTFLKGTGLTAGVAAFASQLPLNLIGEASAAEANATGKTVVRRTVCTHCSVGCAIDAVVTDGVWVRQEPVFESPLNMGSHCAKGASIREHGMTENSHRLKYPMKLVDGKYRRISWEQAINEIGD
jgi:formate dehydrogenase major subunit